MNAVKEKLSLNNVEVLNTRSEDLVSSRRNYYDYGTSRAVARLNILLEISMPLIKKGGYFIALKGDKGNEELAESKKALTELSCKIDKVYLDYLPTNNDTRTNIFIKIKAWGKSRISKFFRHFLSVYPKIRFSATRTSFQPQCTADFYSRKPSATLLQNKQILRNAEAAVL